ncbi:HK97 gp10 family phage protein [Clostridium botulinum]|uniref:HK97 gp10 family phage protein n=1 Tax=Clostridium botulinum TaxID=1491 RepID=A0A6B4JJN7_CLOBO|nr:HK97-gp10 family putative phage morphogenesis protein [Clostridium botulinum]EES49233.1 phage protein, HK97 gp10 family [Clostridium botulinum E1 str. 'BoNT E Beluga']MBY6760575.1 HK97 gp10 family phage protein [Clostridium botulinum]MBY6919482.1 HK97 gp10 family phage protein [Clostridium botulinum]MCR1130360.1 HK97 gp10 family phage protein [Clostridium botulinum]NFJ56885.1 hypothetical protein [Clostridium botulinum]
MSIEFELKGFDDIIKQLECLFSSGEIENIDKNILTTVTNKMKSEIKPKIPKSKDNSESGKKGYRPNGHFADNIPQSNIKKKKGYMYITLGEENEDGEYFYWKFKEFGTSKMPPCPVFGEAREKAQKMLDELGTVEYSKLLQKKLDGR